MPIGHPDWGAGAPNPFFGTVNDMAELAVRLGSPVIFSRTGNVIDVTTFEGSLGGWAAYPAVSGGDIDLFGGRGMNGSGSLRFQTGTSGTGAPAIRKAWLPGALGRVGLETAFYYQTLAEAFYMTFQVYTGTRLYTAALNLAFASGDVSINWSGGFGPTLRSFGAIGADPGYFIPVKAVIDTTTGLWGWVQIGATRIDASAYGIPFSVNAGIPRLETEVSLSSYLSNNGVIYLDNVIVTVNEP